MGTTTASTFSNYVSGRVRETILDSMETSGLVRTSPIAPEAQRFFIYEKTLFGFEAIARDLRIVLTSHFRRWKATETSYKTHQKRVAGTIPRSRDVALQLWSPNGT